MEKIKLHLFNGIGLKPMVLATCYDGKNQITISDVDLSKGFSAHYPTLNQLLFSPIQFGYSFISSVDSISFVLGQIQLLSIILLSIVIIKYKFINQKNVPNLKLPFQLLLIIWSLFFLQLKISFPILKLIPMSYYIQFPWRFSLFFGVFITSTVAYLYSLADIKIKHLIFLLLIIQIFSFSKIEAVDYFNKTNADYDAFAQTTSTGKENLPRTFFHEIWEDEGNWQPSPIILKGEGQIIVNHWSGSNRSYDLILNSDSTIVEPTMYFLGWQTKVNQKKINYNDDKEIIGGRIAYKLPAGEYQVQTKFTQKTTARLIGNSISLLSLIFLIIRSKKNLLIKNAKK